MSFSVSISFPPPSLEATVSPPRVYTSFRERPRGLWRARVTAGRDRKEKSPQPISDAADDEPSATPCLTQQLPPRKKPRIDDSPSPHHEHVYWDFARRCSLRRLRLSPWATNARKMDTSSIARPAISLRERSSYELDDWEDLKELFARATEQYDANDASEGLPFLRGVIHESNRCLISYPDPSVLFSKPAQPETPKPDDPKLRRGSLSSSSTTRESETLGEEQQGESKSVFIELPTAFHALLGTALFLFGNLIAQEPSLALEGEPTSPVFYWLAALDVFQIGENLPVRTSGKSRSDVREDWHMAIIWGRTLVCLADDLVGHQTQAKQEGKDPSSIFLDLNEPNWPRDSLFNAIAAHRHPILRHLCFSSATPNDLLMLAMDQISRGILHMPHEPKPHSWPFVWSASSTPRLSTSSSSTLPTLPGQEDQFSRPRELYTIASDVLLVAEKLDTPSERHYWANWADSVFGLMKMEADRNAWCTLILRSRGRCRLIVGSAHVDEMEAALERGEMDVLKSEEAEEAREDLSLAIGYFEEAKVIEEEEEESQRSGSVANDDSELRVLLVEALLTLANLTEDVHQREALYTRAKSEAGSGMDLDLDADDDEEANDQMDESH